ncbi:type I phosphomannose isomerase catalytic subunit [Flavobacterium sp. Fl-77]|uniref:Phosphohexomutase n=1 Tax=Flavobacterium flavipigmentatum TaxID=2893884 RepID=A0AAJ2VWE2_9FLAO|nr:MULTISPECIES: type I phosphomannose isomerase catalytic subunit [unclassified Flavobacterium]MDX6182270.1 type I phosphomannose isomerase catalytic subunit [Flavobacterium sp. Fl-33]MDX6185817.1 type I phosphomannose isomerase catalytic subunit [Flavobacterium sp. Fl-77]UFH38997.1 class I mannose-6-phosphate isomerase [Flavobacterium sp. F-70]
MSAKLYPLQFEPILKERIWGGQKLKTILNKPITSQITGESWELSTVEGDVSIIANGDLKGKSLMEIINEWPNEVLGTNVYERFGKQFPLLFKYLDAREDLSIQVHPNDKLAKERHNSFGKTEMWFVTQADEDARIIVGFKENSSKEEYLKHLQDNTLVAVLDQVKAKAGDVFFLETGTVHAIGAGLVVAEIQQTSDITYRLYDFDRKDAQGNTRELHVDLALDAINYNKVETQKKYTSTADASNLVVDCPYFTTNFIPLENKQDVHKSGVSFTVYMCIEGSFDIEFDGFKQSYKKGDTVLIPAAIIRFVLSGKASILEIYIS